MTYAVPVLGSRYLSDARISAKVDYGRRAVSRPDREHDRPCPKCWHAGRDWSWHLKDIAGSTDDVRSRGQSGPRGCAARCRSDLTGGDKNMRYALVIAMLLGSTLLAQAEPIARDKWIAQTGRASKSCLAKFRQKFGEGKGHNYSNCVTDQTNKAIDDCVGSSEFSNCVLEKSLRVLEVCDLSSC